MLTYSKFRKLSRLLMKEKFSWGELTPAILSDPREAVLFLNSMIEMSMEQGDFPPRPELEQPDPDNTGSGVWDGCFTMIEERPAYIGSDGPSGGSGVGRHIMIRPDSVIILG